MARLARVVSRGLPHHVTPRGNGRQQMFFRMPTTRRILICLFRQSWHTVGLHHHHRPRLPQMATGGVSGRRPGVRGCVMIGDLSRF
jgi:hypothetical protein